MLPAPRRLSVALFALAAFTLASPAAAQLDLPKPKGDKVAPAGIRKPQRGDIAPHLVCSVCYVRNYTTSIEYGAELLLQKGFKPDQLLHSIKYLLEQ